MWPRSLWTQRESLQKIFITTDGETVDEHRYYLASLKEFSALGFLGLPC